MWHKKRARIKKESWEKKRGVFKWIENDNQQMGQASNQVSGVFTWARHPDSYSLTDRNGVKVFPINRSPKSNLVFFDLFDVILGSYSFLPPENGIFLLCYKERTLWIRIKGQIPGLVNQFDCWIRILIITCLNASNHRIAVVLAPRLENVLFEQLVFCLSIM